MLACCTVLALLSLVPAVHDQDVPRELGEAAPEGLSPDDWSSIKAAYEGGRHQAFPVEGTGSGVVVDRRGHILTNAHVIQDARNIEVTLSDGSQWPALLVGSLPSNDLAVSHQDQPVTDEKRKGASLS